MQTNFARLTDEQKTVWAMDTWHMARNQMFLSKFTGEGPNAMFQHITELKRDEKGARAVITLIHDLEGDGVAGDRTLEDNEEEVTSSDQVIQIDQLRHANRHEGTMADQRSVVNFRKESKDVLAYWLADRWDQMAFLTLAGIAFTQKPDGSTRVGSDLPFLAFAGDVAAPTSRRFGRWDATAGTVVLGGGTNTVTATDTISYKALVRTRAHMKNEYIRGIKGNGGPDDVYHVFVTPNGMATLKLDADYLSSVRQAMPRGTDNPFWAGGIPTIDGMVVHEFRHVPNTQGVASGSKYGAAGTIEGQQVLFCGAQAGAFADIGNPKWVEKFFDYDNQPGIAVGKIAGLLKPKFRSIYASNTIQDFGVFSLYTAV